MLQYGGHLVSVTVVGGAFSVAVVIVLGLSARGAAY